MRNIVLALTLSLSSAAFCATRTESTAAIDRKDSFAVKTETRAYTLDLAGNGCVDLKFGGQITSGRIVWRLVDPSGAERMSIQTTRRASAWTDNIKAVPGKWTLTVQLEDATGQSWVRWQP